MSTKTKLLKFCSNNIVLIVCVPLIIGVHWGWSKLQDMPHLVSPQDRKDLPIIRGGKYLQERIAGKFNSEDSEKGS